MSYYKKKAACILLISLLVCLIIKPVTAQSQLEIKAPSAVLMDAGTGTVLFEKNPHEKWSRLVLLK